MKNSMNHANSWTTTSSPSTRRRLASLLGANLLLGSGALAFVGCDPEPTPAPESCERSCPDAGLDAGNTAISGVPSIDAFFGAVIDFEAASARVSADLRRELDAIAVGLGLSVNASVTEIRAALEAQLALAADGLQLHQGETRCYADFEASVAAAAECSVETPVRALGVECMGSCEVEGGVMASCEEEATLECVGRAAKLECAGACTGTCQLSEPSACAGICRGQCEGECTVVDADGVCAGACAGLCSGACELRVGGPCEGACVGECAYTRSDGACELGELTRCTSAPGRACPGRCDGEPVLPVSRAECEPVIATRAGADLECAPPAVELTWQWKPSFTDPASQASFRAWVYTLRRQLSSLAATSEKAERLAEIAASFAADIGDIVQPEIEALRDDDDGRARERAGASCALENLSEATRRLELASEQLTRSLLDAAEIHAALSS